MKSATARLYLDALAALVRPEDTELLEVGCGQGELLREARRRGFVVHGVELSPHAAVAANRLLGEGTVTTGALDTIAGLAGPFGAVATADVIEHVRDPQGFLHRIYELLRPGGAILLVTPSLDSWTRRLLGRHWMEYKVEHLFYFGAAAIRILLERCGFQEIRISPGRKVLTIDYLSRHFDRFRVPALSPVIGLLRRLVPDRLAHRCIRVPASNLMAIARRPSS